MERKIVDVTITDGVQKGAHYRADTGPVDCVKGVTAAQLAEGFPGVEFIWAGRIPQGKVTIFTGAGAAGKSSLITGLAIARAYGASLFLGHRIKPGASLFVSGEDSAIDYWRRATAWIDSVPSQYRNHVRAATARNLKVMDLIGQDYRLVTGKYEYVVNQEAAGGIAYAASLLDPVPNLIVIETVSRFGGDESNSAHSALVMACEGIADRTGAAVVLVSHRGKANVREGLDDAYSARGGSSLIDNARSALVLGSMPTDPKRQQALLGRLAGSEEKELLILSAPKVNFCAPPGPIFLKRVYTAAGMVLKPYEPPQQAPEDASRRGRGEQLRAMMLAFPGARVNARQIREALRTAPGLAPSIKERNLKLALAEAIEDGFLIIASKKGDRGSLQYAPGPVGAAGVAQAQVAKVDVSGVEPADVVEGAGT